MAAQKSIYHRNFPELATPPFRAMPKRKKKLDKHLPQEKDAQKKGGCVVFYLALVLGMLNILIGARVEVQVSQCWHWEAAHSAFSSHLNAFRLQLLHLSLFCIPSQKCLQHPTDGLANIVFHASCI